jgi:Spy/CpxP family protein refolding chaperone
LPVRFNAWTMVFAVAAALLVGFVASTLAYRYRILRLPGESVVARMDRELNLTAAQRSQIRDIMRDARLRIRQYEEDFRHQRRETFLQAMHQIRATLTREQQEKFDRDFLPYDARGEWQREKREGPGSVPPGSGS